MSSNLVAVADNASHLSQKRTWGTRLSLASLVALALAVLIILFGSKAIADDFQNGRAYDVLEHGFQLAVYGLMFVWVASGLIGICLNCFSVLSTKKKDLPQTDRRKTQVTILITIAPFLFILALVHALPTFISLMRDLLTY